jgi:hypothetical protein
MVDGGWWMVDGGESLVATYVVNVKHSRGPELWHHTIRSQPIAPVYHTCVPYMCTIHVYHTCVPYINSM